jgi:hypothetical protein
MTLYAMHCLFGRIRLLWKRVPTIRRPAAAPSVLALEYAQRSPAHQMGRLQLSGVMSQHVML